MKLLIWMTVALLVILTLQVSNARCAISIHCFLTSRGQGAYYSKKQFAIRDQSEVQFFCTDAYISLFL